MNLEPLGNKLAVRPLPAPERSTILHVPQGAEVYRQAEVLGVGPEVRDVQKGATIFANLGTALEFDGVYVIPESAVLLATVTG